LKIFQILTAALGLTILGCSVNAQSGTSTSPFQPGHNDGALLQDITRINHWLLSGYYRKHGVPLEHVMSWYEIADTNPVRRSRHEIELSERIQGSADISGTIRIQLPPQPIHIRERDYYPDNNAFLVGAPQEFSVREEKGCPFSSDDYLNNGRPSIILVYPDGLQVLNTDGTNTQSSTQFMTASSVGPNTNTGRPCYSYRINRATGLRIDGLNASQTERFYDAAVVERFNDQWKRNPGATISVQCELTLPTLSGTYDEPWPNEIYCPVTSVVVRYGNSGDTVFSLQWDGEKYQSPQVRSSWYKIPTFRPHPSIHKGLINVGGLLPRPHNIFLSKCDDPQRFQHVWHNVRDNGVYWSIPNEGSFNSDDVQVFNEDGKITFCTESGAALGHKLYSSWVIRDQSWR